MVVSALVSRIQSREKAGSIKNIIWSLNKQQNFANFNLYFTTTAKDILFFTSVH